MSRPFDILLIYFFLLKEKFLDYKNYSTLPSILEKDN